MRHVSRWAKGFLVVVMVSSTLLGSWALRGDVTHHELSARTLAAYPVAVIAPLPDYVSNGTWWSLDGSGSHGLIVDYEWNVTMGGVTTFLYAENETYMFKTLGLYKITLTVKDNQSRTSQAFTAVVSVLDSDQDTLPDWWEMKYFHDLNQTANGDYDRDRYTNLAEYAAGTDPTRPNQHPNFIQMAKDNWILVVVIAAVIVGVILALMPIFRKRWKVQEKQKIEAALEIERALDHEDK